MLETFGTGAQVVGFRDACNPQAEGIIVLPGAGGGVVGIIQDGHALCVHLSASQMTALAGALLAAAQSALTADALANAEAAGNA